MIIQKASFDKIFSFLEYLYRGNWQNRWGQVPFMDQLKGSNAGESILAHQWECISLWLLLRQILPETAKTVDTIQVYELLALHDIGEIRIGDTPIIQQLKEGSKEKNELENSEIQAHIQELPTNLQKLISDYFREYTFTSKPSLEVLLARYLNSLQGNHFGLVYGKNLSTHSELISKIVTTYFIPLSKELYEKLSSTNPAAAEEIQSLTDYHLQSIKDKGIRLLIED